MKTTTWLLDYHSYIATWVYIPFSQSSCSVSVINYCECTVNCISYSKSTKIKYQIIVCSQSYKSAELMQSPSLLLKVFVLLDLRTTYGGWLLRWMLVHLLYHHPPWLYAQLPPDGSLSLLGVDQYKLQYDMLTLHLHYSYSYCIYSYYSE